MRFRFAAFLLVLSLPLHAAGLFAIDPAHTTLKFSAHRFRSVAGHAYFDAKNPVASRFSIVIRTDSKTNPYVVFDSSKISAAAKGFVVRGILWVNGTTRHIVVPFDFTEKRASRFTVAGHFTTSDAGDVDFKFAFRRSNDMHRAMELLAKNDTARAAKEVQRALDAAPHSSAARTLGIVLGIPLN
jgi:hypothetical protein